MDDNNIENRKYSDINRAYCNLEYLFQEEKDLTDFNKFSRVTNFISKSNKYLKEELNLQVLNGILSMIHVDEKVTKKEYDFLKKWLNYFELPKKVDKKEILSTLKIKK